MADLPPILTAVDAALASAVERSGGWLACRPGCHACCVGVFPISALDAELLRAALAAAPEDLAAAIHDRATAARARLAIDFPGDAVTGELFTAPHHEEAFADFANDEPCPVLNPATGTCELYAARPVPCRTFGPPIRDEDGNLGVCELCFTDAPPAEVERCEMDQSWRESEQHEIESAAERTGQRGETVIAFALTQT
jgi:Fe-S-cluster containining protein